MVFFYLVTTDWMFYTSLCENSINQSKYRASSVVLKKSNSIRFGLSLENEQADAGPNGRTRLARPNSQARTGTDRERFIM